MDILDFYALIFEDQNPPIFEDQNSPIFGNFNLLCEDAKKYSLTLFSKLPPNILVKILSYLSLDDIVKIDINPKIKYTSRDSIYTKDAFCFWREITLRKRKYPYLRQYIDFLKVYFISGLKIQIKHLKIISHGLIYYLSYNMIMFVR